MIANEPRKMLTKRHAAPVWCIVRTLLGHRSPPWNTVAHLIRFVRGEFLKPDLRELEPELGMVPFLKWIF